MDRIVKWTNTLGIIASITLIYWVSCSISITAFDLKVFGGHITGAFFLSVTGIIFVMMACLMLNIMANLTRISNALENRIQQTTPSAGEKNNKKISLLLVLFFLSFPAIFGFLYFGDMATKIRKEQFIKESADALIVDYAEVIEKFAQYSFSKDFIQQTKQNLVLLSKTDENFPNVSLILRDEIESHKVFLIFSERTRYKEEDDLSKADYIVSTSKEERDYLAFVFENGNLDYKYSANDGRYELYYPVQTQNGIIVLYLSQYNRYGKIGS